jgi:4-coumarate--CoA ligase
MIMPFYHVYGQSLVIYGLMTGMTGVILKAFEPELFCASIEKYKVRMLKAVPPMVLFLAKSPLVDKYDLSSVVMISSG